MAELWRKLFKTHKGGKGKVRKSSVDQTKHDGTHQHLQKEQEHPMPVPEDTEHYLTNLVISGKYQQALTVLQTNPAPSNYDCLLKACLLQVKQTLDLQDSDQHNVKPMVKKDEESLQQFAKLKMELLCSGPYGKDPGRLVNICRQLLPDRYDLVLGMCLQQIYDCGEQEGLCRMVAALLDSGPYEDLPEALVASLQNNLKDFLDFTLASPLERNDSGSEKQTENSPSVARQHSNRGRLNFHAFQHHSPESQHSTSQRQSQNGESSHRSISWPYSGLTKVVLESQCFDLRLWYHSPSCSVGALAKNMSHLLRRIQALRLARLRDQNPPPSPTTFHRYQKNQANHQRQHPLFQQPQLPKPKGPLQPKKKPQLQLIRPFQIPHPEQQQLEKLSQQYPQQQQLQLQNHNQHVDLNQYLQQNLRQFQLQQNHPLQQQPQLPQQQQQQQHPQNRQQQKPPLSLLLTVATLNDAILERLLCRALACLVEAGVTHLLDLSSCFRLPATSIYCPAVRHILDIIALVSSGIAYPKESYMGPEAALLCQVGWLPRLGPHLRTWWDALATQLGDTQIKCLASRSCRVRSLKDLTTVRVSGLVGYSADRTRRVRSLKLPRDMETRVLMKGHTQAYLSAVC